MTKAIIFFLLISMPSLLIAQESQFTLEQLDKFDKSKIIINVYELDRDERNIIEPYPSSTKWRAFQDKKLLSERKFFLITGHELEAKQASKYHLESIPLILSSPIACYLGIKLTKSIAEWGFEYI